MKYLLTALLLSVSSTAIANDFTGLHVSLGPAMVRSDVSTPPGDKDSVRAHADIDSTAGALRVGYDHQFDSIVVGASWWSTLSDLEDDTFSSGGEFEFSGWEVRAGYAQGPWLAFIGAGEMYRAGSMYYSCPPIALCDGPAVSDIDDSAGSYRVGLERRLGPAFIAASYSWADFDAHPIGFGASVEGDVEMVIVAAGWRF